MCSSGHREASEVFLLLRPLLRTGYYTILSSKRATPNDTAAFYLSQHNITVLFPIKLKPCALLKTFFGADGR
jgi:hypothetical protein